MPWRRGTGTRPSTLVEGNVISSTSSAGRAPAAGRDLPRTAALVVGAVFLLVGVLGFVPLDTADNWLHLVLGVGMVGLGVVLGRRRAEVAA
jgi:hypothetical protein